MTTDRKAIDPLEKFVFDVQTLALENPHVAVMSKNAQFKTIFFNVYLNTHAEAFVTGLDLHPDYAYVLAGRLIAQGYTVKFIPRNKHGYCQCTISRPSGEENGFTEVLTGESGKMSVAVIVAFVKHMLCLRDAGEGETYWHGRTQNSLDQNGFR